VSDGGRHLAGPPKVKTDEHTLGVRQIANDLLDGLRQLSHESGDRQYLIAARELRVLEKIDELDRVPSRQIVVADLPEVRNGLD
jgi:hypothetical protein